MDAFWLTPAFIDWSIAETYSVTSHSLGMSCCNITGYVWGLQLVSNILDNILTESLLRLPEYVKNALSWVRQIFPYKGPAGDLAYWTRLSSLKPIFNSATASAVHQEHHLTTSVAYITSLASDTIARIRVMHAGDVICLPIGIGLSKIQEPIYLLMIIFKPKINSLFFNVAIINVSGVGNEYHAYRLEETLGSGTIVRDALLVLTNVIPERLTHSSFWIAVYRLLLRPGSMNMKIFYTVLLPYLNRKPLLCNWITSASSKVNSKLGGYFFDPPPDHQPGRCVIGSIALLFFLLQLVDSLKEEEIHVIISVLLRWGGLLGCRRDLKRLVDREENENTQVKQPIEKFFHSKFLLDSFQLQVLQNAIRCFCFNVALELDMYKEKNNDFILCEENFWIFITTINWFKNIFVHQKALVMFPRGIKYFGGGYGVPSKLFNYQKSLNNEYPDCFMFPWFGRFTKIIQPDISKLEENILPLPLILPVNLTSPFERRIETLSDISIMLRNTHEACVLLGNQRDKICHSYILRFQLIRNVILNNIPLPLPLNHASRATHCFWASQELQRETKTELMRLLYSVAKHFITVCFSLYNSRDMDAQRIIVMAAICVMIDAVLRTKSQRGEEQFPLGNHYSGDVLGPVLPFCFDVRFFSDQSEFFLLLDPILNVTRTQILDYMHDLHKNVIKNEQVLFCFEENKDLDLGCRKLLEQISLQYGFPHNTSSLINYFTGTNSEFSEFIPEWVYLRDTVFYFKALMIPDGTCLPDLKRWSISDATLKWSYNVTKNQLMVSWFDRILDCFGFVKGEECEKRLSYGGGALTKFLGWLGMSTNRTPPSAADPSNLIEKHGRIETEDDVLYLKKLPDFNGKLTTSETEIVLQYLTVPYLRIPLILQFFSNVEKIDALSSSADLRNVLMASLFEPSLWQPEIIQCTSTGKLPFLEVPPENRTCYGTALGLLFNELVYAPLTVLTALERLLDVALQRDAGHVESPGLMLILFVTRLTVIIIHYVDYVVNHHAKWASHGDTKSMCGSHSLARGLQLPTRCARVALEQMKQKLNERIETDVLPLLEERATKAVRMSNLTMACVLYAHIVYIFKNELPEDETNMMRFVSALLYVMIHHRFSLEAKENEHGVGEDNSTAMESVEKNCLGVAEMDIFLILETHRLNLLKWFAKHEEKTNTILENSLALVSFAPFSQTRSWKELFTFGGRGRMVPSIQANLIEATQSQILSVLQNQMKENDKPFSWSSLTEGWRSSGIFNSAMQRSLVDLWGSSWVAKQPKERGMSLYESWLRAVTCRTNDTELNFQLGDFSLKNKQFSVLDPWIRNFQEFQDLFESTDGTQKFQAVVIQNTEKRYWCRLIGLQHDLDCWDFDARCAPYIEAQMPYCSENLRPCETWITDVIDSWVERHLPGAQLFLVRYPEQYSPVKETKNTLFESTLKDTILDKEAKSVHLMCTWPVMSHKKAPIENKSSLKQHIKEIVITKNPMTITVFNIVEHGRWLFSVPCYTSDMNLSYCFPFTNKNDQLAVDGISRVSENKTLCITRDVFSEIGFKQRYVPNEFLHGLIPGYLLTQYIFWQNIDEEENENTVLYGYLKEKDKSNTKDYPLTHDRLTSHTTSLLKVTVYATSDVYKTHHWFFDKKASASAVVEKISFVNTLLDEEKYSVKSSSIKNHNIKQWRFRKMHKLLKNQYQTGVTRQFLVNLRDVEKGSALEELRDSLLRIEDLSCVLVWAQTNFDKNYLINVIEYPRLGLSFTAVLDKGRPSITRKWENNRDKNNTNEITTTQWQSTRFECDQHAGFFLTSKIVWPHCLLARLTSSIPNGILLENDDGELFLLVDALAKPCRLLDEKNSISVIKGQNEKFSGSTKNTVEQFYETMSYNTARSVAANHVAPTIILDRHDSQWIQNLKESKYYLYSIHASNCFLFCPTPAASLYLLLQRFIAKEYTQICRSLDATYLFDHLMNEQVQQIWRTLSTLNADYDSHPDAHATRMKLWLNASRYSCFAIKRETNVLQNILKTTTQQLENHQYVQTFLKMSKWCQDDKTNTENSASKIEKNENVLWLWDLENDLLGYVEKLSQVSGECRLTISEELELLTLFRTFVEKTSILHNRQIFLQQMSRKKKYSFLQTLASCDVFSCMSLTMRVPGIQLIDDFDTQDDRTAIDGSYNPAEWVNDLLGTLIPFKRTEDALQGAAATLFFIKVLDRGITLRLFSDFHFLYELLTEGPTCSNISVIPMESTFHWGALLTRFLAPQDFSAKSELMSVLRIILSNPHLTTSWPRLKDEKRHRLQLSLILRSQETFQTFLKDLLLQLREKEKKGLLTWPVIEKVPLKEAINEEVKSKENNSCFLAQRLVLAGTQKNTSCNACEIHPVSIEKYDFPFSVFQNSSQFKKSNISSENIKNFVTFPLAEYIDIGSLIETEKKTKKAVNFDAACLLVSNLKKKSFCKTIVGKETVERFDVELEAYQEQLSLETKPCLNFLHEERFTSMLRDKDETTKVIIELEKISESLLRAYKLDTEFVESSIFYVEQLANFPVGTDLIKEMDEKKNVNVWAFVFYKLGTLEPYITVDVLIEWMISSTGNNELLFWNPFCSKEISQDIFSVLGAILFTVNRKNQICRAIHELFLLTEEMYQTLHEKDEKCLKICETSMKLKAFNFIQILLSQRHYVTQDHVSSVYDPRFLAFEFAYTLLLRKQQIELIHSFLQAVKEKKSLCHQAVMGAGKTTIVAPLLAILLADQADLIVQVVPVTLLEFTKTIFQERFSAILKKGVMTFSFSRYQTVTPQLLSSFLQAKENKSVCLSTPTDLKSIFLKVVYLFFVLQNSTHFSNEFTFEKPLHSSQMYRKLRGAVNNLLQIPLDFQMEKDKCRRLSNEEFGVLRRELDLSLRILHLFKSSILLIDEIDLILHPLKSELHWPIGPRQPLAFTHMTETVSTAGNVEEGLRWKLPWYLIEPFFFVQGNPQSGRLSLPIGTSRQVGQILEEFEIQINKGLTERYLQTTPHLVLLNEKYYHVHLKPHLARWMNLHLRSLGYHGLKGEETIQLLCLPITNGLDAAHTAKNQLLVDAEEKLDNISVNLLNLCRLWINSLLPHILEKINRVGYGLMTPHEIRQRLIQNSSMPASRQLLAVPFSGKDTPSATSEFAHPDIVIGFTILAYRYTGLRYYDFVNIIHHHKRQLGDGFGPVHERPSAVAFKTWVTVAGGSIRALEKPSCIASKYGSTEWVIREACRTNVEQYYWRGLSRKNDRNCEILLRANVSLNQRELSAETPHENCSIYFKKSVCSPPLSMYNDVNSEINHDIDERLFKKIKPLQFISLEQEDNKEELFLIYNLLWREPLVIQSLLFDVVFPLTLRHCTEQFSASGQELGSSMLFPIRLGFSGTPNALLPFELNKTVYQRGIYGKMVHSLTSLDVTSVRILEDQWSVESLLDLIASTSDINALIDTGAFIMGFSNLEVAKILLKRGLKKIDGVVFFDDYDRQMVLLRDEGKIIKLAQCGLALEKRFTFYDQVHTTGQDIKQHPTAKALLTVGKDMTFRDIAQGSWRMRGIGMGQTIIFLITPEVLRLITNSSEEKELTPNDQNAQCTLLRDMGNYSHLMSSKDLCNLKTVDGYNEDATMLSKNAQEKTQRLLVNILQWSIEKGICGELFQYRLLLEQNMCTLWRRNAFRKLCEMHSQIGATRAEEMLNMSLNIFRDSLTFPIPSSTLDTTTTSRRMEELIKTFNLFLESEADKKTAQILMKSFAEYETESRSLETLGLIKLELNSLETQVIVEQEQEQEEEAEEEEEQEQEEEEEKEQAHESIGLNPQNFVRPSENILRWKLNELSIPPLNTDYQEKSFLAYTSHQTPHTVFLPLSQFTIPCVNEEELVAKLKFPSFVWASRNAVDFKRKTIANHRLKNVLIVMEWVPDFQQKSDAACATVKTSDVFDVSRLIEKVFYIFDREQKGYISLGVVRYLLLVCGSFVAEDAIWEDVKASIYNLLLEKNAAFGKRGTVSSDNLNVSLSKQQTFKVYQGKQNLDKTLCSMEGLQKRNEEQKNLTWISCSDLQYVVKELSLLDLDSLYPQRYYVFLSLDEAEAVRAALHVAIKNGYESVIPTKHVKIVLRNVLAQFCAIDTLHENDTEGVQNNRYNDGILKQRQIAHAFFRFFNCEALYSDEHVECLLRYLSSQSPPSRQVFYNAVLFCRRRATLPLNIQQKRLFQADNDIFLVQLKALALRIYYELSERSLSLSDAFVMMDTDSSGRVNSVQLYAGLRWLGIRLEINDFLKIWNHLPKFFAQESCLESDFVFEFTPFNNIVDEYRRFAYVADLNSCWKKIMCENTLINTNFETEENTLKFFSQQNITSNVFSSFSPCPVKIDQLLTKDEKRQLGGELKVTKNDVNYQKLLESKACERLKFRLQAHTSFVKVWEGFFNGIKYVLNTHKHYSVSQKFLKHVFLAILDENKGFSEVCPGSIEAKGFSIWRPDHLECRYRALTKRNRERICLGDFICQGTDFNKRFNEKGVNTFSPLVLEVEDPKASYFADKGVIRNVINVLLPHPIRFKPILQDIQAVPINNLTEKRFTIWQPIPPDENLFVHCGYVVSCTEKPPSLETVRCVPLKWTQKGASTVLCKLPLKSGCRQAVSLCVSHTTHQLDLSPFGVNELQSAQFRLCCGTVKQFPLNSSTLTKTTRTHRVDCSDFLTGDMQFSNESSDSDQREDYIPELIPKRKPVLSKLWF